jgi:hypothetical protein
MAQIRQRQVKIQVTSADPSGKVFKGIYADANYKNLLTSSKVHDFTLNAGQTKELYIRYSQKPVTVTFKGNSITNYTVTGAFGTVPVGSDNVVKTLEFPTDVTPTITIGFTSATVANPDWKIPQLKVNGQIVTLPYTTDAITPGSNIIVEAVLASATTTSTTTTSTTTSSTTTTTAAPAVLKLQSNTGGTVIKVTSDGINLEEVSLAGTTQSSVVIDMKDAPLVDA